MGVPVFPLVPREKCPPATMTGWQERATTDPAQIAAWNVENQDYNVALVAQPGGVCFLEFDIKGGMKAAAEEMGQALPQTRVHVSGKGFAHYVFRHTVRSQQLGNRNVNLPTGGEWFSFRAINRYVVGPGSIHPNGNIYKVARNVDPIPVPDWVLAWIEKHSSGSEKLSRGSERKAGRGVAVVEDFDFDELTEFYGIEIISVRDNWHITAVCPVAGHRHEQSVLTGFYWDGAHLGFNCFAQGCLGSSMTIGGVLKHLNETHEPYPEPIWSERECEIDVDWAEDVKTETVDDQEMEAASEISVGDLMQLAVTKKPGEVITGDELEHAPKTKQESAQNELKYPELQFPYHALPEGRFKTLVDKACEGGLSPGLVAPAILTLASAVPICDDMEGARINVFTCLLAMVGAGKDTAIDRAIAVLGLEDGQFTAYTPSGERSLSNLLGDRPEKRGSDKRIAGPRRRCIVTFEIEDTMNKSKGDTSSVLQALHWFYDHNDKIFSDSRSSSIQKVHCRLSWLTALPVGDTEVDEETFRRVFGEQATHGLVSRLWFGFSEERFDRRRSRHWQPPVEGITEATVQVDGIDIPVEETHTLVAELMRNRVEEFAPGVEQQYLDWAPGKDWSGRDTHHVLKAAILCALLNEHKYIEKDDWLFAVAFMAWQGRIRETFAAGRSRQVTAGQFHETVMHEIEKRTAKLKKIGKSDRQNKIVEEDGSSFFYYIRWRAMANAGRWYKYGVDVEKTIDVLVRGGALAYLMEPNSESGKDEANKKWVRLI